MTIEEIYRDYKPKEGYSILKGGKGTVTGRQIAFVYQKIEIPGKGLVKKSYTDITVKTVATHDADEYFKQLEPYLEKRNGNTQGQ